MISRKTSTIDVERLLWQDNGELAETWYVAIRYDRNASRNLHPTSYVQKVQNYQQNLASVSLRTSSVVWNKPTPVGVTNSDQAKLSLYKFHYEKILSQIESDRLKVVHKDTDSLVCRIKTASLYKDMSSFKQLFDLSEYPEYHFLHDKTNKKEPLTLADELNRKVLKKVVCLRSKL